MQFTIFDPFQMFGMFNVLFIVITAFVMVIIIIVFVTVCRVGAQAARGILVNVPQSADSRTIPGCDWTWRDRDPDSPIA